MTSFIQINQIILMIHTNVPNGKPIPLTSDILHSKEKFASISTYPYITDTIVYPKTELLNLFSKKKEYVLKFFFDKNFFETILNKYKINEIVDEENKKKNVKKNIQMMLEFIFSTRFPNSNALYSSHYKYISQNNGKNLSLSPSDLNISKFSYLKMDNKIYTIASCTILDDIFNNPEYKSFIDDFLNYNAWKSIQKKIMEKKITEKIINLINRIKNEKNERNVNTLYIFDNIDIFKQSLEKINQKIQDKSYDKGKYKYDSDMKNYIDNLERFIEQFESIKNEINKINIDDKNNTFEQLHSIFDELYALFFDLYELYKIINENRKYLIQNIKKNFNSNLNIIMNELKKINVLNVIYKKYINVSMINAKYDLEESDVLNELKTNYKRYVDFTEKIKNLLPPKKKSFNDKLQNLIKNFFDGNGEKVDGSVELNEIIFNVKNEFMLQSSQSYFSNSRYLEYLYTDVCEINMDDIENPKYEIHLGVELIEGEINDENIHQYRCKYYDYFFGNKLEKYFKIDKNKFDYFSNQFFVQFDEQISTNKQKLENEQKISNENKLTKTVKGGKKRKMNKTQKHFN